MNRHSERTPGPWPKGTVRAIEAVDGPLAYLSVHRRRSAGLQVGGHAQQP
ncbi:MAG TPA: hypothetical protein VGP87_08570 [Gemmatimonadales bacterium]|nr:hypothetical protein [Gemmatimonadales bacterium]